MEASDLTGKTVTLTAGGTTTFTLEQPTAGATLDAPGSDPARAGYRARMAAPDSCAN